MKIANCQERGDQDLPYSFSLHCKYTLNLNKRCKIIIVYTFLTVCEIFPIHLISIEKADIKVCLYFVDLRDINEVWEVAFTLNYRFLILSMLLKFYTYCYYTFINNTFYDIYFYVQICKSI